MESQSDKFKDPDSPSFGGKSNLNRDRQTIDDPASKSMALMS
jgi:hypothetical protein